MRWAQGNQHGHHRLLVEQPYPSIQCVAAVLPDLTVSVLGILRDIQPATLEEAKLLAEAIYIMERRGNE